MQSGYHLLAYLAVIFIIERLLTYWRMLNSVNHHPGHRRAISDISIIGVLAPAIPGITPGTNYLMATKFKSFKYFGWDVVVEVTWLPKIAIVYLLADAAAIKEVTSSWIRFPKPLELYTPFSIFGDNILTTEGDAWRRYRKLTTPAFSTRTNKLVWAEATRVVAELFDDVWGEQKQIEMDHCLDLTLPIALFILGAAEFGKKISWRDDDSKPAGHELTFKQALHYTSSELITKAITPTWALGLTPRLRRARLAYKELGMYMKEMLQERKGAQHTDHHDLFSSLLASKIHDSKSENLADDEIFGNMFLFLVAGHETTAHTLCFAFALLALHQEEQERLYQDLVSVLPNRRFPVYDDIPLLSRSMAVFYETLRLFPPVTGILKVAAEDTTLTIGNQLGEKTTVPVPKGTRVTIDTAGLHYNPRYWPDPEEFKPDRFLDPDWPRDAFLPFSAGPRVCIGRKFFETEGIAALTMIILRYKVTVKEEPQFSGETFEQKKARITANRQGPTLA
ncbi:cytochrome P450 [Coprinopsis sp. MPI-PUGE-AT-0042]|nr:cytochrome P450 [Coprinopsis sp. MPI-PUGE-AT-0042]